MEGTEGLTEEDTNPPLHTHFAEETSPRGPVTPTATRKDDLPLHTIDAPLHFDLVVRCPYTQLAVSTPFRPIAWRGLLANYPERDWAHRLVHDLIHGVDIGYYGTRRQLRHSRNFADTPAERSAVTADILEQTALGHIAGPFNHPPYQFYRCSPLKTVPKKGNASKLRIVHHLSHPHGRSINSFTRDWPCPLQDFDHAIRIVRRLGRGCYMAKMDVKAAYRCIPVRPADWPLLGMQWDNRFYFHRTLPFGLRSACHLWERYATALEWIIRHEYGVEHITHYVDDTFIANATKAGCAADMTRGKAAGLELGVPDAADKTEGPTTALTYLGIQIDSIHMSISLDTSRVAAILQMVHEWRGRSTCSLRQLQSLLGTLQWAAQVVRHGRTFLQHLGDSAADHALIPHPDRAIIAVSADAQEDLTWWADFLDQWNGISLLWEEQWLDRSSILQPHTDACVEGFAAVCGSAWFHARWTEQQEHIARDGDSLARDSMPWKELYAIVAAAATWGPLWERKRVIFFTDCMPVVQALSKGASRTRRIMQLIRALHHYAARFHFVYKAEHIAGDKNVIADELSRVFVVSQLSTQCRRAIDPSPIIPVLPNIPS